MEGLQRSAISFRRQGSSGLIWDDKLLKSELDKLAAADQQRQDGGGGGGGEGNESREEVKEDPAPAPVKDPSPPPPPPSAGLTIERSRSNGGRGFRTGKVSPAIDPPSPKVSACGFCGAFGKSEKTRSRPGKRVV